jgi:hypothetical protein
MKRFPLDGNLLVVLGAAVGVACSTVAPGPRDAIVFSHHVHTEQGVACNDCHGALARDAEGKVDAIPRKPDCASCHDVQAKADCKTCHANPAAPAPWSRPPQAHLVFSHEAHLARVTGCDACHRDAAHAPALAPGRRLLPSMSDCARCHQDDLDSGRCPKCHERLDLYPQKPETLYQHKEGFFAHHGARAMGSESVCATCHDQSFCADCHAKNATVTLAIRYPERIDREFIHRGDWISRHSMEARLGETSCLKCHGTRFCTSCHERQGVGGQLGSRMPASHGKGWMAAGGAESHGRAARRDIMACASCHDQGPRSNCVKCHSANGGVNPHPPGFACTNCHEPRLEGSPGGFHEVFNGKPPSKHKMCRICHTS